MTKYIKYTFGKYKLVYFFSKKCSTYQNTSNQQPIKWVRMLPNPNPSSTSSTTTSHLDKPSTWVLYTSQWNAQYLSDGIQAETVTHLKCKSKGELSLDDIHAVVKTVCSPVQSRPAS